MNWGGLLRVAGPKLIGLAVGAISGWVYVKTAGAVSLNPENAEKLIGLIITMSGSATTAAKVSEAYVNPVGAPSPVVAQEGVAIKQQLTVEQERTKTTPEVK